jgi:hypothetical protein
MTVIPITFIFWMHMIVKFSYCLDICSLRTLSDIIALEYKDWLKWPAQVKPIRMCLIFKELRAGCGLVVEHLPNMYKAIPNTTKREREREWERERERGRKGGRKESIPDVPLSKPWFFVTSKYHVDSYTTGITNLHSFPCATCWLPN